MALSGTLRSQSLQVSQFPILDDQVPAVRVVGLAAHQFVTVHADLVDGGGRQWSSAAQFLADDSGVVDLSIQSPVSGSYSGVSGAGLIWSMMPIKSGTGEYEAPADLGPQAINLSAIVDGKDVAHAQLIQTGVDKDVLQVRLKGVIHGVMLIPASPGPHPGLLVLGGSEGGIPLRKAGWLASHGYVALALAYFNYENLPSTLAQIPLEYFGQALTFLAKRPEVIPEQIGVVGTSRGAELALQLSSMYPQIRSVVAYAPADIRYSGCCGRRMVIPAWTWQGKPLDFAYGGASNTRVAELNAAIQVEHIHGDVLLISGSDDGVWSSDTMADSIMRRLKAANFAYRYQHLCYPKAGHHAGRPLIVPTWTGGLTTPANRPLHLGGTPGGNALSTLDAVPKTLEFLSQSFSSTAADKAGEKQ